MKIKNIQLLSLLLCTVTTQAWGKGEFETSGPISEPVTHNEPTLRDQYLEQQRLLRAERAKENPTATQTPVEKPKSGFIRNLLNKLKPTNTVDNPSSQGADGLTPHEEEILKEIEEKHKKLDATNTISSSPRPKSSIDLEKTTNVLEELFKAELKKQNPDITNEKLNSLVQKLDADIKAQLKGQIIHENASSIEARLKTIRETMNELLAKEKLSREQATQKPNQTPTKAVSLPPFAKDTQEGLTAFNKEIAGLRKKILSQNETTALNTIVETLDNTINTIKNKKPDGRNWLFRSRKNGKWSKLQEQQASDALNIAQEKLANFNAVRTVSKEIYSVANDILLPNYLKGTGRSNAAARNLLDAAKKDAKKQIEKGTFDASAKQTLLEKLRTDLTNIRDDEEKETQEQSVDQETEQLQKKQDLINKYTTKIRDIDNRARVVWDGKEDLSPEVEKLVTKYKTLRDEMHTRLVSNDKIPTDIEIQQLESLANQILKQAQQPALPKPTLVVTSTPEPVAKPVVNLPARGVIDTRDLTPEEENGITTKKTIQLSPNEKPLEAITLKEAVAKYKLEPLEKNLLESINEFKDQRPKTYTANVADIKNPAASGQKTVISPDLKAWDKANQEINTISNRLDQQIRTIYYDTEDSPARDLKQKFFSPSKLETQKVEALKAANAASDQIEEIIGAYKKTQAQAYDKRNPDAQEQKKSLND